MKKKLKNIEKMLLNINNSNEYIDLYKEYLYLKKMCDNIELNKKTNNKIDALDVEDSIYMKKNKKLKEKEKILYEYSRIKNYLIRNKLDVNEKDYLVLNNIASLLEDIDNNNDYIDIKKKMVKIEMQLGMIVGFYSTTKYLIDDLEKKVKENNKKLRLEK